MRPLDTFWELLKPEAVRDRVMVDWQESLGEDFAVASLFLQPTGALSEAYPCPSPGHDGCPRRVVQHPTGERVAVCGAAPSPCDSLDLKKSDLAVYRFALVLFVVAARQALGLRVLRRHQQADGSLIYLGQLPYSSTPSSIVYLLLTSSLHWHSPRPPDSILLTVEDVDPAPTSDRWNAIPSRDVLGVTDAGMLCCLDEQWAVTALRSEGQFNDPSQLSVLHVPSGTSWKDVSIRFTDGHTVEITVAGTKERMNFAELGMKDRRSGNPDDQWELLRGLSNQDGELTWASPVAHLDQKKQCQRQRAALRRRFGIQEDPIPYNRRTRGWRVQFHLQPLA